MDILPPYEVYIDESNSPAFQSKPGLNSPYVVCAIAIPVVEKERIEILLPRDEQGHPIKASSPSMTDHLASQFIREILKFDVLFSLVALDSASEENCKIADALTEKAASNRKKKITKPNLMYERVAAEAIIQICASNRLNFFDIVFDSNSVPKREFDLLENILKDKFPQIGVTIRHISRKTEQQAPLLFASDIIAGIGKRKSTHQDVYESWNKIIEGKKLGKVLLKNGIETYHAG